MLEGETTRTVFVTDRFRLEVTFEETDKDGKTVYRTVSYDKLRLVPGKFIAAICILLTALTVELREGSLFIDGGVQAEIYFRRYSLFNNWNTLFLGLGIHF